MPETQSKIAIVTFNQGPVHHAFAAAIAQTFASRPAQLVWLHTPTHDRNVLLPMIDRSGVDIVVWINPNIIWNPEDLDVVLDPIERGAATVVGALYHNQRDGGGLIPVKLEFEPEDLHPLRGYVGPLHESGRYMYLRARRLPFGFLAIKRDVLMTAARTAAPYHLNPRDDGESATNRLFNVHVDDENLVDEDHAACDYLRVAGAEIWVSMDLAVLQVISGQAIGAPGQPPRIHEFAAEAAKAKVKK